MRLTLRRVGHRFAGRPWLFRDLSFSLHPGRVHGLIGPSGSGKSTLLGVLAGWIEPEEGDVAREQVGRIGWVFQSPFGVARRTVIDHVALPLLAAGRDHAGARAEAMPLLKRFGLEPRADSPFGELSGGEAQRLMLARSIAARPSLMLVDEPTAQLDAATAREVADAVRDLATEGTIIVVATHDPVVRDACTEVIDLAGHRRDGEMND
jgi:lipoprotein-releasing system ATP-binding protein